MMQTVCQLVNNELISNKKCSNNCNAQQSQQPSTMNSARSTTINSARRESIDFQISEPRQNWLNNNNNNNHVQKSRTNSTDELISFTQRMNNG